MLVALGAFAPVAAAARVPKVALIVGPVGDTITARYRALANEAATVARSAGAEVVKVYSPNATWPAVREAISGASIVVYLGHGNGWPSPLPRLAVPAEPERLRAQPRRRAVTTRPTSTSARRRSTTSSWPRTPSCCSSHLCYASAATRSPAWPRARWTRRSSGSTTTPRGSSAPAPRPSSPRATSGPAWYVRQLLTGKGCDRVDLEPLAERQRQHVQDPERPVEGLRLAARSRQPLVRLLPLARVPWRHHRQRHQVRARWARSRTRSRVRRRSRRLPTRP